MPKRDLTVFRTAEMECERDTPNRFLREGAVLDDEASRECQHSPVAGDGAGAGSEYSLDNSFLRS